ncbi:hypothetical protein ABW20_dc0101814 [Dactylellina cionopaga]|nr:hypothetical protein ABW20_dc0101814 [Dactylellina cionopaga]
MLCSTVNIARTAINIVVFASALVPFASAICYDYGYPPPAAVCNVSPDSNSYLAILEVVSEDTTGECQASDAPYGGQYYEKAKVVYTGVDNQVSTVSALSTISDVSPTLTGTYTFSYNIPHTSILNGSPVTVYVVYSIPGFGDFATSTSAWTETHVSTVLYTVSTSTSTTPYQVFIESTSTSTSTVTSTFTPAVVQSTVVTGTSTITAPTPSTTITSTITPIAKTVYKFTFTVSTKTLNCYSGAANRRLRARDGPVYDLPDCDPITVSTVYTSTSIVFADSTTTITDTDYVTVTSTSTTSLDAVTSYISVGAFTTVTPPTVTKTARTKIARSTVTKTITFTVVRKYLPLGRKTPPCTKQPHNPPHPPAQHHTCPFPLKHR